MSDKFLHHEGHEHPSQDWQGGLPPTYEGPDGSRYYRPEPRPYGSAPAPYPRTFSPEQAEREQAYRELDAEEERQKKLAKLGERVLAVLTCAPWPGRSEQAERLDKLTMVEIEAAKLGLFRGEDEPGKPDHASQERASFERETLERYMGGE